MKGIKYFVFFVLSYGAAIAMAEQLERGKSYWDALSSREKIIYVQGFRDGTWPGVAKYCGELNFDDAALCFSRKDNCLQVEPVLVVARVDKMYSDEKNKSIYIFTMIDMVCRMINGFDIREDLNMARHADEMTRSLIKRLR